MQRRIPPAENRGEMGQPRLVVRMGQPLLFGFRNKIDELLKGAFHG